MTLNTSRLGQAAGAGDVNAIFLRQFSGEIITAFESANIMMGLHTIRTITSGKSAQFPVIGTATAAYHTAGTSIKRTMLDTGGGNMPAILHNERTIGIDDTLLAPAFIDNLDEAKTHYEYRSEYSRKLGYALAKTADQNQLIVVAAASALTAASPQGAGGGEIDIAGTAGVDNTLTSAAIVAALFQAAAQFDENDIPDQDRVAVFPPSVYYNLLSNGSAAGFTQSTSVANKDIGGSGFGSGIVPEIAGFAILKSNNLPRTNVTTSAGVSSENSYTYAGATSDLVACVFHRSAIGTVKLKDLALESEYSVDDQGTLMVAKYAMGHGVLRPDAAIVLTNSL